MLVKWSAHTLTEIFQVLLDKIEAQNALDDPVSEFCEYYEKGFDWEKAPLNMGNKAIHKDSVTFAIISAGKFVTAKEMANDVFERTKQIPKWRKMYVDLKPDRIQIKIQGGLYRPKHHTNPK